MTYQVVEFLKRNFLSLCVKGGGAEVIWAMPESKQWCSQKLSRDSLWPGSRTEWRVWSKTETRLNSGPRAGGHCADTQRSCSQFCPFLPQFVPLPLDQFRNPLEVWGPCGTIGDSLGKFCDPLGPFGGTQRRCFQFYLSSLFATLMSPLPPLPCLCLCPSFCSDHGTVSDHSHCDAAETTDIRTLHL